MPLSVAMKTKTNHLLLLLALFCAPHLASAYYDPGAQRWINRDPIGERGGLNVYRFLRSDPMRNLDPWGLSCESDLKSCKEQAQYAFQNIRGLINCAKGSGDTALDTFAAKCNDACASMVNASPEGKSACRFICSRLSDLGELGLWGGYVAGSALNVVGYGAMLKSCHDEYANCVANRGNMPPVPNPVY
jgi:hypothetical protein